MVRSMVPGEISQQPKPMDSLCLSCRLIIVTPDALRTLQPWELRILDQAAVWLEAFQRLNLVIKIIPMKYLL